MVDSLVYKHNESTEIKNIYFNEVFTNNIFLKKLNIYNPDADEPLQKFWFYINKASIIKKNNNFLILGIFNKDKNLINSINNLDQAIYKNTQIYYKVNNYYNSIKTNNNFLPSIKCIYSNEIIIDDFNNNLNYNEIKELDNISVYIELSHIVINSNCTPIWKILQIKKNKVIDLNKSFFNNNSENFNIPNIQNIPNIPKVNIQNSSNNIVQKINNNVSKNPIKIIPSVQDILSIKANLKKNNKSTDKIVDSEIKKNNFDIPLKKVETNVAKSMVEILKMEHLNKINNKILLYEKSFKKDQIHKKYKKIVKKIRKISI